MTATHRNFQSIVPAVADAEDMSDIVGMAICHQYLLDRGTSPREESLWAPGELQDFSINLSCVDRLYHIHKSEDDIFELVARLVYKNRYLFVELSCGCHFEGFEVEGGGQIYVSYDARLFAKVITTKMTNEALFYQSLAQDGYEVERSSVHERWPAARWDSPPSLGLLSHLAVSNNIVRLSHYPKVLSATMVHKLDEFMHTQKAMKEYDEWD